jgi:hypothetical protein
MNNPLIVAHAGAFAERVCKEAGGDPRAQVVHAWRLAYAAEPTEREVQDALAFLAEQTEHFRARPPAAATPRKDEKAPDQANPRLQALASFCHALISANQFLYVD